MATMSKKVCSSVLNTGLKYSLGRNALLKIAVPAAGTPSAARRHMSRLVETSYKVVYMIQHSV